MGHPTQRTRIRLVASVWAVLFLIAVPWFLHDLRSQQRRAAREQRLNATEHEMVPPPHTDLDRG